MQGMQQAEKGDGIQAKEGGMTTDYPVDEAMADAIRWAEEYAPEIVANIEMIGAMLKRSQWQPIETAPRDGTKVLLCHSGYAHPYYDRDRTPRVWVDFFRAGSWYNTAPSGQPTHWRPLPAPPIDAAGGR